MKELLKKIKTKVTGFFKKFGKYILLSLVIFLSVLFGGKIDDLFRKHDDKKKQELKDAVNDAKEKAENASNAVSDAKTEIENVKDEINQNIEDVNAKEESYKEKQKENAEKAGFKKKGAK